MKFDEMDWQRVYDFMAGGVAMGVVFLILEVARLITCGA